MVILSIVKFDIKIQICWRNQKIWQPWGLTSSVATLDEFFPLGQHPSGSQTLIGEASTCQCRRYKRHGFDPWVRKIPWRRKWQSTLMFLPGESHGLRSLVGYSPWGRKELDTTLQMCAYMLSCAQLLKAVFLHAYTKKLQTSLRWVSFSTTGGAKVGLIRRKGSAMVWLIFLQSRAWKFL